MGQRSSGSGRGARGSAAGGAAPPRELPPPPRGIDTSFELVAMETANGAGRRRGFGMVGARDSAVPRARAASREPPPPPTTRLNRQNTILTYLTLGQIFFINYTSKTISCLIQHTIS